MKVCVVIPVYNHGEAVGAVVSAVRSHGLPCVLVDDGSEPGCAAVLDGLAASDREGIQLVRLPENQGKGGAMIAGFRAAKERGFSHALQIDADGQHDTSDIPRFVQLAEQRPDSLVCGTPIYDESVPKSRLYGRYATHIWVWINTLSFAIRDSMCGFRVYPIEAALASGTRGDRMDFDIEIPVRMVWNGVPVRNAPVPVRYLAADEGGISHYQTFRDTARISWTHTKLVVEGILRALRWLFRRLAGGAR